VVPEPYKVPPTPEMAALLAAMEAKARAPAKERKASIKKRPARVTAAGSWPHDAHVWAYRQHRILYVVAERLAAPPSPNICSSIAGGRPIAAPRAYGRAGQITHMSRDPSERRQRVIRRLTPLPPAA
jgi:hypothetical protein